MTVARHALTRRSESQRSGSHGYENRHGRTAAGCCSGRCATATAAWDCTSYDCSGFSFRLLHLLAEDRAKPKAAYHTMSVKFSDHDHESPLDLVLVTGRHGPYFNARTMDQFHAALKSGSSDDMKEYLLSMPVWYVVVHPPTSPQTVAICRLSC